MTSGSRAWRVNGEAGRQASSFFAPWVSPERIGALYRETFPRYEVFFMKGVTPPILFRLMLNYNQVNKVIAKCITLQSICRNSSPEKSFLRKMRQKPNISGFYKLTSFVQVYLRRLSPSVTMTWTRVRNEFKGHMRFPSPGDPHIPEEKRCIESLPSIPHNELFHEASGSVTGELDTLFGCI